MTAILVPRVAGDHVARLLHCDNDDVVQCFPTVPVIDDATGAVMMVPLIGRTDGIYFLSTSGETSAVAVPVHTSLVVPLVECSNGAIYSGVSLGATKTTRLGSLSNGTTLYHHFQFTADYHVAVASRLHARSE